MSGFLSSVYDKVHSVIETSHEAIDPQYQRQKEFLREGRQMLELTCVAAIVGSIVFAILGIAAVATAGAAAIPIFLVVLPLGYLSYNSYVMSRNVEDIIEKPKKYFTQDLIRNQLLKNTFWFDWSVTLLEKIIEIENNERQ